MRDCFNCNQNLYFVPKSGIGLSIEHYNLLVWSFLGIKGNTDLANTLIYPELELGMKSTLNHFIIGGSLEVFYRNDINYELKVSSSYYLKRDLSLNTQIEYTNFIQNISFTTGFKLHF